MLKDEIKLESSQWLNKIWDRILWFHKLVTTDLRQNRIWNCKNDIGSPSPSPSLPYLFWSAPCLPSPSCKAAGSPHITHFFTNTSPVKELLIINISSQHTLLKTESYPILFKIISPDLNNKNCIARPSGTSFLFFFFNRHRILYKLISKFQRKISWFTMSPVWRLAPQQILNHKLCRGMHMHV